MTVSTPLGCSLPPPRRLRRPLSHGCSLMPRGLHSSSPPSPDGSSLMRRSVFIAPFCCQRMHFPILCADQFPRCVQSGEILDRSRWNVTEAYTSAIKDSRSLNLHALCKIDVEGSLWDGCCFKCLLALFAFFLIKTWHYTAHVALKMIWTLSPYILDVFGTGGLPFACVSNSIDKPTPLHLDVSLPSFEDVRWSLSRLYYLFNIQLEQNIGLFLVALLAACFSFVIIGGFMFYKYRLTGEMRGGIYTRKNARQRQAPVKERWNKRIDIDNSVSFLVVL